MRKIVNRDIGKIMESRHDDTDDDADDDNNDDNYDNDDDYMRLLIDDTL